MVPEGQSRFLGGHLLYIFTSFFSINAELFQTSNIELYKKVHSLTVYIESSSKYVGGGVPFGPHER